MTRIVKESHSFSCHLRVYPYLPLPSQPKLVLIYRYGGDGRLSGMGLCTTRVSKQSAQDRYVTGITVVSCSNRHVSLGNWNVGVKRRTHDLVGREP